MKTKGFTLIELLAVIVILAIIALIAVPIILNIIGDSKKEGNKRSIDMYAEAIKIAIAKASIKGEVPSGSYKPEADSKSIKLKDGDYILPVDYDKSIVECETTELYKDGTIYLADCKVNGEDVKYTYGTKQEETKNKVYANGDEVYFDVKLGTSCTNYVEGNSATGYKGIETPTEENNNCLKFYTFLDDEKSSTLNLILDHNTTARIAWVTKEDYNDDANYGFGGNNNKGPLTLLKQLKTDTNGWTGVTELATNDTYTPSKMYNNGEPYTINYNGYRARIISAEEVAKITENDNWTIGDEWYYFDTNTNTQSSNCYYYYDEDTSREESDTSGCHYGWLYDRTATYCTNFGCLNNSTATTYGYWTVSAYSSDSYYAWGVRPYGALTDNLVDNDNNFGLRPVITVSKSDIS